MEEKEEKIFQVSRTIYAVFEYFLLPSSLAFCTARHPLPQYVASCHITHALSPRSCASKLHVQYLIRVIVFHNANSMQHIRLRVSAAAVLQSCRVALHGPPLAIGCGQCESLGINMELHRNDEHELRSLV